MTPLARRLSEPAVLEAGLAARGYLADPELATVLSVALRLRRPLLLEGEPGVGKTQLAKTLADVLGAPLIRLQCYEGIDVAHALYDWNYARQMLHIRTLEAGSGPMSTDEVFSWPFLVRRPLLQALEQEGDVAPVLLIDEIDRADDEFEAFLLEFLSDFRVTIPELGPIGARIPPIVLLTSNRTRELHDALRRRCVYHWIDHPSIGLETDIVRASVPGLNAHVASRITAVIAELREMDLTKSPGIAETLDWAQALEDLAVVGLDPTVVRATLGVVLKHREDIQRVRDRGLASIIDAAGARTGLAPH